MRPKTWTDEDLAVAIKASFSMTEVMEILGLKTTSNRTRDRLRERANALGLDRSHFIHGGARGAGSRPIRTNEEIFCKGVHYSATTRRRFLVCTEYECSRCGISEWQGQSIVLQIDHKDGDTMNNELENLRFLCPNCHSQTETWGKKKPN